MIPFQLELPKPPDIAIIVLDDVSTRDLAIYGGDVETPHLAALSAMGFTFDRCYANALCGPTRRSILTGHWWVGRNGPACDDADGSTPTLSESFLPESFTGAGWRTSLIGKWHIGGDPLGGSWEVAPISHGFDEFRGGMGANTLDCGGSGYTDWLRADATASGSSVVPTTEYETDVIRTEVQSFWTEGKHRLAVICPQLPHAPFHDPPGFTPAATDVERYHNMIIAADDLVGDIISTVDISRTVVFVVGDNGTPNPVSPEPMKSKGTVFERGVNVPLIIAGPGVPHGSSSALVHVVDIWRTAISMGGGSPPSGSPYPIASRSLLPLMRGKVASVHEYVLCGAGWGDSGGEVAAVSLNGKLRWFDFNGDGQPELTQFFVGGDETVDESLNQTYAQAVADHEAFLSASVVP